MLQSAFTNSAIPSRLLISLIFQGLQTEALRPEVCVVHHRLVPGQLVHGERSHGDMHAGADERSSAGSLHHRGAHAQPGQHSDYIRHGKRKRGREREGREIAEIRRERERETQTTSCMISERKMRFSNLIYMIGTRLEVECISLLFIIYFNTSIWLKTTFRSPYLAVFLSSILLQTSDDFMRKVRERIGGSNPYSVTGYVESPLAYDAVWALALALNKTQNRLLQRGESLENFKYSNENIMKEIYSAMNSTGFLGISVSRDTALQLINTNIFWIIISPFGLSGSCCVQLSGWSYSVDTDRTDVGW